MAPLNRVYGLGSCLLLAIAASAQDANDVSSLEDTVMSKVEEVASSVTPAPEVSSAVSALLASAVSTNDVPLSLFTQGLSLLSSYYPSTTLTGLQSLTWPGTVVIGSQTYTLSPSASPTSSARSTLSTLTSSSATSSQSPSQTSTPASTTAAAGAAANTGAKSSKHPNGSHDISDDKKLGIILGVVLGFLAFAIAGVMFFCLWRRRKDTGSFFIRRTPSTTSSEFRSWRGTGGPSMGNSSYVTSGHSQDRHDRYARLDAHPDHERPAMVAAPNLARHHSSRSTSDENPFYTPQEEYPEYPGSYQRGGGEMRQVDPSQQDTSYHGAAGPYQGLSGGEMQQNDLSHQDQPYREAANAGPGPSRRPPSPFNPLMMAAMSGAGTQSEHQRQYVEDHQDRNPFMSPDDEEGDEYISPTIPSRHVERRNSPRIHYPSWNEVSEFDFAHEGRQQEPYHYTDGGDGWHPVVQRKPVPQPSGYGRHELP